MIKAHIVSVKNRGDMSVITLKQLALLWRNGKITLPQAKERAKVLEYPVRTEDKDGTVWFEPDGLEDNLISSVEDLIYTGQATRDELETFFDYVFP